MAEFIAASFVQGHTERPLMHSGELLPLSRKVSEEKKNEIDHTFGVQIFSLVVEANMLNFGDSCFLIFI